jgi:hypothetical protein
MLVAFALCGGCSTSSTRCSDDSDCFQGEVCVDETCEPKTPSENVDTNSSPNGETNNSSNNSSPNTVTGNNFAGAACVVDLVGNQCVEDDYEPNPGYEPGRGGYQDTTVWESGSWCSDSDLSMPTRSFSGILCPGDQVDAFRFVVSNSGPACIESEFTTFRITVELQTDCPEELLEVQPYTFGADPVRNDLCSDDEDVVCSSEDDGMTRIVEWVWPRGQSYDPRVQIVALRDDVQIDYDVTVEVLPQ